MAIKNKRRGFYLILVLSSVPFSISAITPLQREQRKLVSSCQLPYQPHSQSVAETGIGKMASLAALNIRSFARAGGRWLYLIASTPRFLAMTARRTDHALSRLTGHSFESCLTPQVRRAFEPVSRLDREQSIDWATFSSIVTQTNFQKA